MIKSLVRTFRGPSRDPMMAYISRPLPRYLPDEQVVTALQLAFAADPDPESLVETLPPALKQVTGHEFEVMDRSTGDVTGTYRKVQIMIRDGEIGLWPGYKARAYPLLAPGTASADAPDGAPAPSPTSPAGKPGWQPPAPIAREEKR